MSLKYLSHKQGDLRCVHSIYVKTQPQQCTLVIQCQGGREIDIEKSQENISFSYDVYKVAFFKHFVNLRDQKHYLIKTKVWVTFHVSTECCQQTGISHFVHGTACSYLCAVYFLIFGNTLSLNHLSGFWQGAYLSSGRLNQV